VATYISLINWTDQGIKNVKETIERSQQAGDLMSSLGVNLKEIYWTVGPYDVVGISEAPDEETATASLLALGAGGAVRTTTLRAFNHEEMARILQKLG